MNQRPTSLSLSPSLSYHVPDTNTPLTRYGRCSFSKTQAGKDYVLGANTMFLVAPFLVSTALPCLFLINSPRSLSLIKFHNHLPLSFPAF